MLTFAAVVVAMVLFRSPTVGTASELLQGMLGLNGITLPQQIFDRLGPITAVLQPFVSASVTSAGSGAEFTATIMWIVVLLAVALAFPNSLQVLARYEPALGVKSRSEDLGRWAWIQDWRPTVPWAFLMSAIAVISVLKLGGKSEFLYWQF
jgi:hypothetical protein